MLLNKKTAIVTGGAQGIGKSIVQEFLDNGATVYALDYNPDTLQKLKSEINTDKLFTAKVDISKSDEVFAFFDDFAKEMNVLSILVNNAGITRDKLAVRMSEDDFDSVIEVNLKGAFLMSQRAMKMMIKSRAGSIINISSVIAYMGGTGQVNYASSKAGLLGLTRAFANEGASRNIRVNAILPGYIETEMTQVLPADVKQNYSNQIPLRKFGSPSDIAKASLFLASDMSSYITGQFLFVDGGLHY